jgi:hypothetical protein
MSRMRASWRQFLFAGNVTTNDQNAQSGGNYRWLDGG